MTVMTPSSESDTPTSADDTPADGARSRLPELIWGAFFAVGLLIGLAIGFAVWGGSGSTGSSPEVVIDVAGPDQEVLERVGRAVELQQIGDRAGAEAIYREVIELDPAYPVPYFNLGVMAHEDGDLETAIAEYRQAIDRDGSFLSARFNLAIAARDLGDTGLAIAEFEAILAQSPDDANVLYNLALIVDSTGDTERAEELIDRAQAIDPAIPDLG